MKDTYLVAGAPKLTMNNFIACDCIWHIRSGIHVCSSGDWSWLELIDNIVNNRYCNYMGLTEETVHFKAVYAVFIPQASFLYFSITQRNCCESPSVINVCITLSHADTSLLTKTIKLHSYLTAGCVLVISIAPPIQCRCSRLGLFTNHCVVFSIIIHEWPLISL